MDSQEIISRTTDANNFALGSLEAIRTRLLDLTGRNRLLNFKYGRSGFIRVIDELPNQLAKGILDDTSFMLIPIEEPRKEELIEAGYIGLDEEGQEVRLKPDPSAREWAKYKGFNVDYDLPESTGDSAGNHKDTKIQSLLYPGELESNLRSIRTKANTAIEETGANILYLALGFLAWFEDTHSHVERLAPLYLIPVRIDKLKLDKELGTYRYSIQYTGEDIVPNLSLKEKLKIDFGLELPLFKDETEPEDYFKLVEDIVLKNKPRWSIKRHGTLSLFNFGNLLMYLDLDPSKWPDGNCNIKEHPIIKKFFANQGEEGDDSLTGFPSEYAIDDLEDVHELYPLIDDADSSQHSALIDAVKGDNLVIEGPPGSGKSQTITNLIAAAIAQGKKVLFVAEKMAALQVVKSRLEKANLSDFCLELHSNKTQKKQVYQSLAKRIALQSSYRYPNQINMEIAMYEEKKDALSNYAELINSEWKSTGRTINQIFSTVTRYRDQYSHVQLNNITPENIDGNTYDELSCRSVVDELKRYVEVFDQIRKQLGKEARLEDHPWFGVYNTDIQHFDCNDIAKQLSTWQVELENLLYEAGRFNELVGAEAVQTLDHVVQVINVGPMLPKLTGLEDLSAIKQMSWEHHNSLNHFLTRHSYLKEENSELRQLLEDELLESESVISRVEIALQEIEDRLQTEQHSLSQAFAISELLNSLQNELKALEEDIDVIKEQLSELTPYIPLSLAGIDELYNFVSHVSNLDPAFIGRRAECFDDDRLDNHLSVLKESLDRINWLRTKMGGAFNLSELPTSSQLREAKQLLDAGGIFKWFKSGWRLAKTNVLGLAADAKPQLKKLLPELSYLLEYIENVERIDEKPHYQKLLGTEFKHIETNADELLQIREWYKDVRECYGVGFGKKVKLAQLLFSMPEEIFRGIKQISEHSIIPKVQSIKEWTKALSQYNFSVFKDQQRLFFDESCGIVTQTDSFREAVKHCQKSAKTDVTIIDLSSATQRAKQFLSEVSKQNQLAETLNPLFEHFQMPELTDSDTQVKYIEATLAVSSKLFALPNQYLRRLIQQRISTEFLDLTTQSIARLEGLNISQTSTKATFSKSVNLDENAWMMSCDRSIGGILKRNEVGIEQPMWLSTWVDFIRIRKCLADKGLEKLLRATEKSSIELNELEGIYNYAIFDVLSREIIIENQQLSRFSGAHHNAIRSQFARYDHTLKALQQEKIAFQASRANLKEGVSSGKVATYSEMGLIRNEINKKARHVSIRQLIARAGKSLQELKPCFMMGPHSVAQYLEPGKIEFDLVVMDEASQIKPQDALGTIARGKQIIVVGDPKQLPPTSFFDKAIDTDDQDITAIEQSESILDVSMPMFKARRLRWHYRSRHESLIAFSNQEFYDSNLIIFPSPSSESDEFGVKFEYIPRGRFINQRNVEEALVVAKAVRAHILHREEESLGVVAMSAQQREQIERCVDELSKDDELFRNALERDTLADEPLFIKNLENVQGDERDVIYISCTYGPQEAGATTMPQRFGPINSAAGGRRLNVLFTRSKKRMHVFSSMTEGHILAKDNSNPGVHALKQFLGFAQSGNLYQPKITGKAPDSDFEVAVLNALKREGFTCVPQVGVAGYFIDLAVLDPGTPGRYLMGIECDGATYHSAKSARDRDRLRQSVLENLGWNIRRIWSTDWFKNPQAQLRPIIEKLNALKTELYVAPSRISEEAEIEEIIADEENILDSSDAYSHVAGSLKDKLIRFAEQVVDKETPEISADSKLLRPAMIDALDEFRPVSKSEFQEFIPGYLRNNTDSKQGKYLEHILNIIAEDE